MKLANVSSGADWIIWVVFVIFLVISIMLLSGHGSWFISGYNTAPKKEKAKYDEKNYVERQDLEWQLSHFSFLLWACLRTCCQLVSHIFHLAL